VALTDFAPNFNPLHIDGNTVDVHALMRPTMPRRRSGSPPTARRPSTPTTSPSVELTSTSPQVVTYTSIQSGVVDGAPITWEDIASQIDATSR